MNYCSPADPRRRPETRLLIHTRTNTDPLLWQSEQQLFPTAVSLSSLITLLPLFSVAVHVKGPPSESSSVLVLGVKLAESPSAPPPWPAINLLSSSSSTSHHHHSYSNPLVGRQRSSRSAMLRPQLHMMRPLCLRAGSPPPFFFLYCTEDHGHRENFHHSTFVILFLLSELSDEGC